MHETLLFDTKAALIQFKDVQFVGLKVIGYVILMQNLIKHKFGPVWLSVACIL